MSRAESRNSRSSRRLSARPQSHEGWLQ